MTMRSARPILSTTPYALNLGTLIRSILPGFDGHYIHGREREGISEISRSKLFRALEGNANIFESHLKQMGRQCMLWKLAFRPRCGVCHLVAGPQNSAYTEASAWCRRLGLY